MKKTGLWWENLAADLLTANEERQIEKSSKILYRMYEELQKAGFSSGVALYLVSETLKGACNNNGKN